MKIALLSYRSDPFSGGQGVYVKNLSSALVNLGHEVDVISGPPYPELENTVKPFAPSASNVCPFFTEPAFAKVVS